jgi:DNA-binding PadR family transcriptional regulator
MQKVFASTDIGGAGREDTMALRHAILASLLDDPKTGYDLAKQFGDDGYFWRASHQQIYLELGRLEDEGAIVATGDEPGPRGDRRRTVTAAGRDVLADWARRPSGSATIKEDVLVQCLALGVIEPAVLIEQINRHRAQHADRLADREHVLAQRFPDGAPEVGPLLGRYLALQGGVSYERAWVQWADLALASLGAAGD